MSGYIGSKNGNTKQNRFNLQNNNIFASRSEKVGTKYREIKFWFWEYCKVQHLKQWLVGKKNVTVSKRMHYRWVFLITSVKVKPVSSQFKSPLKTYIFKMIMKLQNWFFLYSLPNAQNRIDQHTCISSLLSIVKLRMSLTFGASNESISRFVSPSRAVKEWEFC